MSSEKILLRKKNSPVSAQHDVTLHIVLAEIRSELFQANLQIVPAYCSSKIQSSQMK